MQNTQSHTCPACGQEANPAPELGSSEYFSCRCGNLFQTENGLVIKSTQDWNLVLSDEQIESLLTARINTEEQESLNRCPGCGGQLEHPDDRICHSCHSNDPANNILDYQDDESS